MRNLKNFIYAVSAFCAVSSYAANDWNLYFDKIPDDPTKKVQELRINWDTATGSQSTDGYWYTGDARTSETAMHGWLSDYENDNFTFGNVEGRQGINNSGVQTTVYDSIFLNVSSDLTFGSVTFLGHLWDNSARIYGDNYKNNLTIKGNINKDAASNNAFIYNINKLDVGGIIDINGGNFAVIIRQMHVAGDIYSVKTGANIYATVSVIGDRTFEQGLAAPDAVVDGVINGVNYYAKPTGTDNYVSVGGVTNTGSIRRQAAANGGSDNAHTSTFILKNKVDYSTTGAIYQDNGSVWNSTSGNMAIVMNGTAKQTFTSNSLHFQGGVKVISGSLAFNFSQSSYSYYRDSAKKIRVQFVTDDSGSVGTAFTHGNLEMLGGVFSAQSDGSYGAFRFTDLKYTSGTINLRLTDASKVDSIDLTSYYNKVTDSTSGSAVVSYEKVEGGTLTKLGAEKITFNFDGDLSWVIDDETGSFVLNGGKGAKIIAWDSDKKPSYVSEDFAANIFSKDSKDYTAFFTTADDGLYVKYVVVPEPAELAMIFGAAALILAAYRRRK